MLLLKILIIEDDETLLNLYQTAVKREGYHVLTARNGKEAWTIMDKEHVDLIISDIMMPVMDGYEFIKSLREQNSSIPILIITAKDDFASKKIGFSLGTDDYMTKPVNVDEMLLRIGALLRRAHIAAEKELSFGSTILNLDTLTVSGYGHTESLPPKEFFLLYKLLSYPSKIFTRIQLMEEIWGVDSSSELQTIDVHINRLRRKFENNPDFEILTIRGLGYKAVIHS